MALLMVLSASVFVVVSVLLSYLNMRRLINELRAEPEILERISSSIAEGRLNKDVGTDKTERKGFWRSMLMMRDIFLR